MDADATEMFLTCSSEVWDLSTPVPAPDLAPACSTETTFIDSETEELLQGVDPNQVFSSRPTPDSSESDCDETEDQRLNQGLNLSLSQDLSQDLSRPRVYQLVYDPDNSQHNIIPIELDSWPQILLSDSCVVNELVPRAGSSHQTLDHQDQMNGSELQLTEEEQKLLNQEGVSLPGNQPLTKAEERILKKVRRKIRNKQSAQDSRRRRKEYVDALENRVAECSAQNRELVKTVEALEKSNMSLLSQLRQLQSLIKRSVSKGAQTSTCLLIIMISLGLIILPSFSPFLRRSVTGDDYRPTGVMSRNILTDSASLQPPANDDSTEDPEPSDVGQSGTEVVSAAVSRSQLNPELTPSQNQSEIDFAPVAEPKTPLTLDETRKTGTRRRDVEF